MARRSRGALLTSIHAPQLEGFQPQAPAAHLRTFWSPEPMQPRYTRRPQVSQSPVSGQQDTLLSDALYALPPSLVGLGVAHSVTYNLLYYLLPLCCLASQVNDYFLGCPHTTPPPARNYTSFGTLSSHRCKPQTGVSSLLPLTSSLLRSSPSQGPMFTQ